MKDRMRKEFEGKFPVPSRVNWSSRLNRYGAKSFDFIEVRIFMARWEAWQASRESLVIELPSDQCIDIHGYSPKATRLYCRKAIEAAGLKVMP
jgi:hypothetical protein